MKEPFYQAMMAIELTRDQARDFALEDPDSFANFVMAYHSSVVTDYIKHCPEELTRFVMDGGLSEED